VPDDAAVEFVGSIEWPATSPYLNQLVARLEADHPLPSSVEVMNGELCIHSWRDAQVNKAHGQLNNLLSDYHVWKEIEHLVSGLSYQGVTPDQTSSSESHGFTP
jgi:hypothetical protein